MKKKSITRVISAALASAVVLTACQGSHSDAADEAAEKETAQTVAAESEEAPLKVTFITTASGLGDRSFNDSAWEGVQKASEDFGVDIAIIEPQTVADFGTAIISAVESGSDLILGFAASWTDAFEENCEKFPDVCFGGLNATTAADNLQVAMTSDHEGSFLAGALAALMTKNDCVGVIGAVDADNINRFIVGYEEGAKYINPDITVLTSYVGSYTDPAKGKEYAMQLYNSGADVIFHVAAGTGEGVFEAAREIDDLYAIGVDSDQDYIAEGKVLTSMMKNCDNIAYNMIQDVLEGNFESGDKVYGLANDGIGLSPMTYTKDLVGDENLAIIEEIRQKIIDGEIVVTDVYEQ